LSQEGASELQLLIRSRSDAASRLGENHAAVRALDELVESTRASKRAALPASAKLRDLEACLNRRRRAKAGAEQALEKTETQLRELQALATSQRADIAALDVEIQGLQADVQAAAQAVAGESKADAAKLGVDEADAEDIATWPEHLQQARRLALESQATAEQAKQVLRQALDAHKATRSSAGSGGAPGPASPTPAGGTVTPTAATNQAGLQETLAALAARLRDVAGAGAVAMELDELVANCKRRESEGRSPSPASRRARTGPSPSPPAGRPAEAPEPAGHEG